MSNLTGVVSRVSRFGLRLSQFKSFRPYFLVSSKLYHHCFVSQKTIHCSFPYILAIGFIPRRQSTAMSALSPNDPASHSRPDLAVIRHIDLKLNVDFDQRVLSGSALLKFEALQDVDEVILDASNLTIQSVELENGTALKYKLSEHVPNFGSKLTVDLPHAVQPVDKDEQLNMIAHGNFDLQASTKGVTFSKLEKHSIHNINTPKIKSEPKCFTLKCSTCTDNSKENILCGSPEKKEDTTFNYVKSTPLVTKINDKNKIPTKFNTIQDGNPRENKSNKNKPDSSHDIFETAESYFIAIAARNKKIYDIFEPTEKYFIAAQNEVLESKDDKSGGYDLKNKNTISENCNKRSEENRNMEDHHKSRQAGNLLEDNNYKPKVTPLNVKENTGQTCKILDFNSINENLKIPEQHYEHILEDNKNKPKVTPLNVKENTAQTCKLLNFNSMNENLKIPQEHHEHILENNKYKPKVTPLNVKENTAPTCKILDFDSINQNLKTPEEHHKHICDGCKLKGSNTLKKESNVGIQNDDTDDGKTGFCNFKDDDDDDNAEENFACESCHCKLISYEQNDIDDKNSNIPKMKSCLTAKFDILGLCSKCSEEKNKMKKVPRCLQQQMSLKETCVSLKDLIKFLGLSEPAVMEHCNKFKAHCCHFGEPAMTHHCNKSKAKCVSSPDLVKTSCIPELAKIEDCNKSKDHCCYCGEPAVIELCNNSKEICVSSTNLIKSPCHSESSLKEHCNKLQSSTDLIEFSCLRIKEPTEMEDCDKLKENCVSADLFKPSCLYEPAKMEYRNKLRDDCCYCVSSTDLLKTWCRKETAVIKHCNKFKENCVSSTDFVKIPCLRNPVVLEQCTKTHPCKDFRTSFDDQTKVLDDMLKYFNARLKFIEENCEILENQRRNQYNPIERSKICVCSNCRCVCCRPSRESIQMVNTPVSKKPQPDANKINCNFKINFMLETSRNISGNKIHSSTGTVQDDKNYVVIDGQQHNLYTTKELYNMTYKKPNNFLKKSSSENILNLYASQSEDNSENSNSQLSTSIRENYIIASGKPSTISYEKRFNIRIQYRTAPSASALQWLSPMQTSGKKHPYLFSQCQPIHARSILPCQDSPAVKFTYNAEISAPEQFTVLMSALFDERKANKTVFHQPVPIPSYLLALAVGVLESRTIGPRSKVWAEEAEIEKSAWEFAETENYLKAAEKMCGSYPWKQYDLLVLPPSFPYGGMENPCLTFVTPSLLAGDRSQADVIVHEIMHSWTGNLVTNKNFEHFWLNEGFTVFLERKVAASLINNATEAKKSRDFQSLLGLQELSETVNSVFEPNSPLTCMVVNLTGVHPDEAFSSVPYEKGSTFLRYLEDIIGIEVFDDFLRSYLNQFQKQSLDTDQFKTYLFDYFKDTSHSEKLAHVDWKAWLYTPGMPPIIPDYDTSLTKDVTNLLAKIESGNMTFSPDDIKGFTPHQIINFLQELIDRPPIPIDQLQALGAAYKVASSQNSEIKYRWLRLCVRSKDVTRLPEVFDFLNHFGRMKYVRPIYRDLYTWEDVRKQAIENFLQNESNLMHVSAYTLRKDLHLSDPILNV